MRKGRRASSSSDSEGSRESDSNESSGSSSDREPESDPESESSSDLDVGARGGAMKRSQGFSTSFSFAEDDPQQQQPSEGDCDRGENSDHGGPVEVVPMLREVEEEPPTAESRTWSDRTQPQRSGLFRPQQLWLAVSRCLSLHWPPCLSIGRLSNAKLAYGLDRPEDGQLSLSSGSTNRSSTSSYSSSSSIYSSSSIAPTLAKPPGEGDPNRAVGRGGVTALRRGISRSTSRLPRARAAVDSALASFILERETFLTVELVESGDEHEESHYRAQWKLSEKSRDLAEGVWLSRSPRLLVD